MNTSRSVSLLLSLPLLLACLAVALTLSSTTELGSSAADLGHTKRADDGGTVTECDGFSGALCRVAVYAANNPLVAYGISC